MLTREKYSPNCGEFRRIERGIIEELRRSRRERQQARDKRDQPRKELNQLRDEEFRLIKLRAGAGIISLHPAARLMGRAGRSIDTKLKLIQTNIKVKTFGLETARLKVKSLRKWKTGLGRSLKMNARKLAQFQCT